MSSIELEKVTLDYPVLSPEGHNLKRMAVDFVRGRKHAPPVIRALHEVSLSIPAGTRLGLFGPNGSGKSSLLKLMAGVYLPTSGSVRRRGRCMALLGLGLGANVELSARDNIALLLRLEGIRPTPDAIEAVWDFAELDPRFFDLSLRHFSSGMIMRLFFAVSTFPDPEILLMDEWLSVLDQTFMHKAEDRLRSFVGRAGVFVIASHNRSLLEDVCHRIAFLDRGHVVSIDER